MEIKTENEEREARRDAAKLLRKYLDKQIKTNDSWLVTQIKGICATTEKELSISGFSFENSRQAADWNAKIIAENEHDFQKAIEKENNTTLSPGSEFRSIATIKKILAT